MQFISTIRRPDENKWIHEQDSCAPSRIYIKEASEDRLDLGGYKVSLILCKLHLNTITLDSKAHHTCDRSAPMGLKARTSKVLQEVRIQNSLSCQH